MSHHFKSIEQMIEHIDQEAARYSIMAERSAKERGLSARDTAAKAANERGLAAAYRALASSLRVTVIGKDLRSAVLLTDLQPVILDTTLKDPTHD